MRGASVRVPVCVLALAMLASALAVPTLRVLVHYPHDVALTLRGDQCGLSWEWGVKLSPCGQHTACAVLVTANCTGELNFKVLVNDAVWQRGANERVALPLHGTVHVYPAFYSTAGAYRVVDGFVAPRLGNTRSLVVYVPPSYDENAAKHYPLLVCHDGQNMFNDSTAAYGQSWRAQQTLDGLIEEGGMEELVVVAVYNAGEARLNEYTYSVDEHFGGGKGDAYLDFLEDTVVPYVRRHFRIDPVAPMGLLGSSLGGLITCYAGYTRSSYARVACMSSSFWWNREDFLATVLASPPASLAPLIYLDSGDSGDNADGLVQTRAVHSRLLELEWPPARTPILFTDHDAEHNEYFWGRRLWRPLKALFPHRECRVELST